VKFLKWCVSNIYIFGIGSDSCGTTPDTNHYYSEKVSASYQKCPFVNKVVRSNYLVLDVGWLLFLTVFNLFICEVWEWFIACMSFGVTIADVS